MQRASAAFGLLIFILWLGVIAVGLAYIAVWAATRKRPQWQVLGWLLDRTGATPMPEKPVRRSAEVIPFERHAIDRKHKQA